MRARILPRLLPLVVAAVLVGAPPVGADPIADLQAEAARLNQQIAKQRETAAVMAERFNQARYELSIIEKDLGATEAKVAALDTEAVRLSDQISGVAIRAYVYGSNDSGALGTVLTADSTQREAYLASLVGDVTDVVDRVRAFRDDSAKQQEELEAKKARKDNLIAETEKRRVAAEKAAKQLEASLAKTKGELAEAVEADRIRREREAAEAAQRAYEARVAQERIVRERAARAPQGRTARLTPSVPEAPAPSSAAARAVAAARSQLGVPYVWAAENPGRSFDCSGLTKYAWGTVGVYMGHWTVAQQNQFPRVPFGQEQPGDLVMFGSPPHHVGIYVGNGQMIHAPYTGTVVQYGNAFGGSYVGAVRPG